MLYAVLHINDTGISLFQDEIICYREPGYAFVDKHGIQIGKEAIGKSRIFPKNIENEHWLNLSTSALKPNNSQRYSSADLVSHQLEEIQAVLNQDTLIIVIVPPYMTNKQLSLFLGIANDLNLSIIAFIESSVAASRYQYTDAKLVHIELHLHSMSVSLMSQEGKVKVEESIIIEKCGQTTFYKAWINMISAAFIDQCRFDPLHSAESDQAIIDGLPLWISDSINKDAIEISIKYDKQIYKIEIESAKFCEAAKPLYRLLINRVRSIFSVNDLPAIQLTNQVAQLPGVIDALKNSLSSSVYVLDDGEIERGALSRCSKEISKGSSLKLQKSLDWDKPSVTVERITRNLQNSDRPTHILYENIAYKIDGSPIMVGSNPTDSDTTIKIKSEITGISRNHCSFVMKDDDCIVFDHSRYGTYLNDERLQNNTILHNGDVVRIGSPGINLLMISIEKG